MAKAQKSSVPGHIMISYQWGSQDLMKQVAQSLRKHKYNVWMDVDNMEGDIYEKMAEGVEGAAIVLVAMSQKYQDSKNCQIECKMAKDLNKNIIPLRVQAGFRHSGWLGLIVAGKLWYDFTKGSFDGTMKKLISEIGDRGKPEAKPDFIVTAIHEVLDIDKDLAQQIGEKLHIKGIEEIRDLVHVEEKDLTPFLPEIKARKLVTAWKSDVPSKKDAKVAAATAKEECISPVLALDVRAANKELLDVQHVLPLNDGGFVISNIKGENRHILRLDRKGAIVNTIAVIEGRVTGLIHSAPHIIVLQDTGKIIKLQIDKGVVGEDKIEGVTFLWDGIEVSKDELLLVDAGESYEACGAVFTYNLRTKSMDVHLEDLYYPLSVSQTVTDQGPVFVVCEAYKDMVHVYSSTWTLLRSIEESGTGDGQYNQPSSALILPKPPYNLLVSDLLNGRVVEFSSEGKFVKNLLKKRQHGITMPYKIRYSQGSIWVVCQTSDKTFNVKKFQIYK